MLNFRFYNPVELVFGKGTIAELSNLIPANFKTLMLYGGGSIKKNGVYDQVKKALAGRALVEFGGIEPNPRYETCMKAVELARAEKVDFLLAVGGGSVLDGTKFISAAIPLTDIDPWAIMSNYGLVTEKAVPLGSVLTLPATGSEMNWNSVVSRESTKEKLHFASKYVFPKFSILDPETTFSLPERQTANGIVDAFIHVMEQYMTYDVNAPLQDRQAEAVLLTLIEEGPKVMADPTNYDARANVMWSATNALNNFLSCGVPQDWLTHMIGHELTALYGLDHAQTLAVVYPGTATRFIQRKRGKLLQFAERVWGIREGSDDARIQGAVEATEKFFRSLGVKTKLSEYGVSAEASKLVAERLAKRGNPLGEYGDVKYEDIEAIIASRV